MNLSDLFRRKPAKSEKPAPGTRRRAVLQPDGHVEHIYIGTHNVGLIKKLCRTGRYLGPTDVIVTALRMLEEHEETREARNTGRASVSTPPSDGSR